LREAGISVSPPHLVSVVVGFVGGGWRWLSKICGYRPLEIDLPVSEVYKGLCALSVIAITSLPRYQSSPAFQIIADRHGHFAERNLGDR